MFVIKLALKPGIVYSCPCHIAAFRLAQEPVDVMSVLIILSASSG